MSWKKREGAANPSNHAAPKPKGPLLPSLYHILENRYPIARIVLETRFPIQPIDIII
jgi:hypothetical protein